MLHDIAFRIRALIRPEAMDAELDDELRSEFEEQVEFFLQQGLPLDEARRQAKLSFGELEQIKERCRDARGVFLLETMRQDLIHAVRLLKKDPVFSIVAILTLAIGIGANAGTLSLLHAVSMRSLSVDNPGQLAIVTVGFSSPELRDYELAVPEKTFDQLVSSQHSFSAMSGWGRMPFVMDDEQGTLRVYRDGVGVSRGMELLGVKPMLGRMLTSSDDSPDLTNHHWAVALSYRFWQERFHSDRNVVGRNIFVNHAPATIVGVAPSDFDGVVAGYTTQLYMPQRLATIGCKCPGRLLVIVLGRLQTGVTQAMASSELAGFKDAIDLSALSGGGFPKLDGASLRVSPGGRGLRLQRRLLQQILLAQALVGIVFLLCSANLAGLMLARSHAREQEFSLRSSLGATRGRLYRQYLTESMLLAFASVPLALLVAWGTASMTTNSLTFSNFGTVRIQADYSVLLITVILAFASVLFFGAIPGMHARRHRIGLVFRPAVSRGGKRGSFGKAFVVLQVGLSLLLLNFAALSTNGLVRLRLQRLGFDPRHVLIQTAYFQDLSKKNDELVTLYHAMTEQLVHAPGMESASFTWYTPIWGVPPTAAFAATNGKIQPEKNRTMAYNYVGPRYFQTLSIRVTEGREFSSADSYRRVCVVNQSVADIFFPHQASVGQYLRLPGQEGGSRGGQSAGGPNRDSVPEEYRIVGVVENAKYSTLWDVAPPTIYFPVSENSPELTNLAFLLRARSQSDAMSAYSNTLFQAVPNAPLMPFLPLQKQIDESIWAERLVTTLSSILCAVSLLLAALGLYGLLRARVGQRRKEFALRLAMGAQRRNLICIILREAGQMVVLGVLLGTAATAWLLPLLSGSLHGSLPGYFDNAVSRLFHYGPLPVLCLPLLILVLVFVRAAYVPAAQAASIEPAVLLRGE
jgi:macrolide transport system ATP-binding/permease protein